MLVLAQETRWKRFFDPVVSSLIAVTCLARGIGLLFSGRPRTPLRVLCIAAFDMLNVIRNGKRLTSGEIRTLAELLDYGAFVNAALDQKPGDRLKRPVDLQWLEKAGLAVPLEEYLQRLEKLENTRPRPGGNRVHFQRVSLYREAVVRLSLAMVATAVSGKKQLDDAIRATHHDGELNLLFRIAMQCQIIDDVLDYAKDWSAALPSFLTACGSLPHSLEGTTLAVREYAFGHPHEKGANVFPLRVALFHVSILALLVVSFRRRWA